MRNTIDYLPIISNMYTYFVPIKNGCKNVAKGLQNHLSDLGNPKIVKIVVVDGETEIIQNDAKITPKGISVSSSIKRWITEKFIYSYVKYKSGYKLEYKNEYVTNLVKYLRNDTKRTNTNFLPKDHPMELIKIEYDNVENIFIITPFHVITLENADEFLKPEDYHIMLKYLFTNINSLRMAPTEDNIEKLNKHISLFATNGASKWLSAEEYSKLDVQNLGMYSLRKEVANGNRRYYTGKAINISDRTVAIRNKEKKYTVGHRKEEQFDEVRYDIFDFNQLIELVMLYLKVNEGVSESQAKKNYAQLSNSILYGIEGVVNHIVRMILEEETAEFANSNFDNATSNAVKR